MLSKGTDVLLGGDGLARADVQAQDGGDVPRRKGVHDLALEAHEYLDGLDLALALGVEEVDLVAVGYLAGEEAAHAYEAGGRIDDDVRDHHDHRAVLVAGQEGLADVAVEVAARPDLGDAVGLGNVRGRVMLTTMPRRASWSGSLRAEGLAGLPVV